MAAAERREQILTAAVLAFGDSGYAGTTTDQIARLAGVSQPYVLRLFATKRDLFCAVLHRAAEHIEVALRRAAERDPTVAGLERGLHSLLADRATITVLLHGFAAGADPVIGEHARDCLGRIHTVARSLTGADPEQVRQFLATTVLTACLVAMRAAGPDSVGTGPWPADLPATFMAAGSEDVPGV